MKKSQGGGAAALSAMAVDAAPDTAFGIPPFVQSNGKPASIIRAGGDFMCIII